MRFVFLESVLTLKIHMKTLILN